MPTGPPKTLDIGEFGEVVVLIAEPNSVPYPLLSLLSGLLCRLGTGRCRRVRMSGLSKRCASNGNSISFLAAKASQDQFMEHTQMAFALEALGNPSVFGGIPSARCSLQILAHKENNSLQRDHLSLIHPTPLYQHHPRTRLSAS
jgi:hypothetical protein